MTAEFLSGNTGFINQVFAINSCAQLTALVTCNSSFIGCYYKTTTPFVDKFSCFWNNRSSTPSACVVSCINSSVGSPFGIRTPLLECCLTIQETVYYACSWCFLRNPISSSNNGNFILVGGGFTGTSNCFSVFHQYLFCFDGVNYCTTGHAAANTSGFFVCCPAMLYSNDDGCTFCRLPGFCIPNTFFCCVCCDGFLYNPCTAGQIARVEIQWGLGGFTCEGSIWQGFRINNLCCKSHGIWGYACATVLANNTPGAWTVCRGSFPFMFTTFCCGYFSGIGGDCVTTSFTGSASGICYSNAPNACLHNGVHIPRFVIGKMTGSSNTFATCIGGSFGSTVQDCVYSNIMRGTEVRVDTACIATPNPFSCNICNFFAYTNFFHCAPTINLMTCTYANTNNIRAWMFQLHGCCSAGCCNCQGNLISCKYITSFGSFCTLLEWNCGTPRVCSLGIAQGPSTLGAVIPIANTLLLVGSSSVVTFCNIILCNLCHMLFDMLCIYCNNFTWGTCHTCTPDSYGSVEPSFCTCLTVVMCMDNNLAYCNICPAFSLNRMPTFGFSCGIMSGCSMDTAGALGVSWNQCGQTARKSFSGHSVQINPLTNTFVAKILSYNCSMSGTSPPQWLYNYPTDGSNANTIYGRWDCAAAVAAVGGAYCFNNLPCGKLFCNILLTGALSSIRPTAYSAVDDAASGNFLDDRIPGCTRVAFCCSFYSISPGTTLGFSISGWPCTIIYGGNWGVPWGSNTAISPAGGVGDYCNTSPSFLPALCDTPNRNDFGRCIYQGSSYGWTCRSVHPQYLTFCIFGAACQLCNPNVRFVCTANGMPGIVFGAIICGSGFYANGVACTTCAFKLRFIDMF
jgi:hypothetical protein